jgi:ABC-type transport system involved in cytochrome bd biosynthesis fused ATPase/permease subunit
MPAMVSSPVAISFSAVLVVIQLADLNVLFMGSATALMIIFLMVLLNWLTKKVTKGRDQYSRIESKSAIKLQELVTNINFVRVNSFQGIFNKMLLKLRSNAEKALRLVHRSYGVIEFILILTPFLFGSVIAILYNFTSENKIEASQTITIVSMMVAVTVPMRALSDSLRKWKIAEVAYKCINSFFETLIHKKKELVEDTGIRIGEIELSNCYFVSDQGASVKRVNDVFNEVSKEDLKQSSKKNQGLRKSYTLIRSRS